MGVATGGWGMAIEGCMHVVVCFVFPSPLFALACSLFHALRGATRPTFKAFWTSEGPKCPQNGLKMGLFHPFVHPIWSRMRSGKMRF